VRTRLVLPLLLLATAALPSTAAADGLPVPVEDTGLTGIADEGGVYRYVSLRDGADTFVARTVQNGGAISRTTSLSGRYTIPAVGIDGSPSGLSAHGRTLVLIRPRPSFPRATTEFAVLDAERLRLRERIALDGDFSFDAISPDGSRMYLIHYLSPRDYTQYEVRAYDLDKGRLVPGAIVDPNEPGEEMYGVPLSRQTSASGRWAYTLYWGNEHPFVHALDTRDAAAVCIDLDSLHGVRDMAALRLESGPGPSTLTVTRRGEPAAQVNTDSFEVSIPAAAAPPVAPPVDDGSSVAIWALAAGAGLLAFAIVMMLRRRRGDAVTSEPAL
jgi:hypothetical protein